MGSWDQGGGGVRTVPKSRISNQQRSPVSLALHPPLIFPLSPLRPSLPLTHVFIHNGHHPVRQ